MKKILFVSAQILRVNSGGGNLAKAHLKTLTDIYGEDGVDVIAFSWEMPAKEKEHFKVVQGYNSKLGKILNILTGRVSCSSYKKDRIVLAEIEKKRYDVVFFDDNVFGTLVACIKKRYPHMKLVSFFHGVQVNSCVQELKKSIRNWLKFPEILMKIKSERLTVENTDTLILLNRRDEKYVKRYYHRGADYYLPIYLEDIDFKILDDIRTDFIEILFVGGYFWPNIVGIKWFIKKVMPLLSTNFHLTIVGNGMERLLEDREFNNAMVTVHGRVESLVEYYQVADVIVGPIFDGDGMKTKTAEALLFGKRYIGTKEALCGYSELKRYEANSPTEFKEKIEIYGKEKVKYDVEMRDIYEKNYSMQMAEKILHKALDI